MQSLLCPRRLAEAASTRHRVELGCGAPHLWCPCSDGATCTGRRSSNSEEAATHAIGPPWQPIRRFSIVAGCPGCFSGSRLPQPACAGRAIIGSRAASSLRMRAPPQHTGRCLAPHRSTGDAIAQSDSQELWLTGWSGGGSAGRQWLGIQSRSTWHSLSLDAGS